MTEVVKKKWYKSKTMWFNMVTFGIVFTDGLGAILSGLTPLIPPEIMLVVTGIVALVNLFLRAVTKTGLSAK